jgi:hypothetical protein
MHDHKRGDLESLPRQSALKRHSLTLAQATEIVARLDYSAAPRMIRGMLKRRKLSGWTRFITIYTLAVCALFVLLLFLYDWFFRNHPWG